MRMNVRNPIGMVAVVLMVGCGGESESENSKSTGGSSGTGASGGTSGPGGTSGSGGTPGSGGTSGACAGYVPQATPSEIAKTPRANADAELLALETSGAFLAPDALYERVSAELPQMPTLEPKVAGIKPFNSELTLDLNIGFDD